jgi:hypothetical protein
MALGNHLLWLFLGASSQKRSASPGLSETPRTKRRLLKRNVCLWEYYEETEDANVVLCKATEQCRSKIRRSDGSTSGMKSHLESRHPVQYVRFLEGSGKEAEQKVHNSIAIRFPVHFQHSKLIVL